VFCACLRYPYCVSSPQRQVYCPALGLISDVVDTFFSRDAISVLSGGISTKLAANIHHVSGHCCKGFQGQRSKVKVQLDEMHFSNGGVIHFDGMASRLTCLSSRSLF